MNCCFRAFLFGVAFTQAAFGGCYNVVAPNGVVVYSGADPPFDVSYPPKGRDWLRVEAAGGTLMIGAECVDVQKLEEQREQRNRMREAAEQARVAAEKKAKQEAAARAKRTLEEQAKAQSVRQQAIDRAQLTTLTEAQREMPLSYTVLDRQIADMPIKSQIELHVQLSGKITEAGVRELLEKLYSDVNSSRGFKYHSGGPTHVGIYAYTSRAHYESGAGQWIAMLSRNTKGIPDIDIRVREDMIAQLTEKPEVRNGLSELTRKEISLELVRATDRADADSQRMYPSQLDKQAETYHALGDKYRKEVADRYGISEADIEDIKAESIKKNWPLPPRH